MDFMLDKKNGLSNYGYDTIAQKMGIDIAPHTLQLQIMAYKKARRFKKIKTKKISNPNKAARVRYGEAHQNKTITGHWRYVYFTDEVHFDASELSYSAQYELRKPGDIDEDSYQATDTPDWSGKVHVAGGITYDYKGHFGFYKDPLEPSEKVVKPYKPRKSKYEDDNQFAARIADWQKQLPIDTEVLPKGNAMSQQFYADEVLPHHIKFIKEKEKVLRHPIYFMEDGDPSHGKRSINNPCTRLKRASDITNWEHPAQSCDLNPIEAVWNIMKQRLRGRKWRSRDHFKADIEAEWHAVTQAQIRRRMREMKQRCHTLTTNNGERIKSALW